MTVVLEPEQSNGVIVPSIIGDKISIIAGVGFSGEYKTGGDITLGEELEKYIKETGRGSINWVQVSGIPGYFFVFNYESKKLQVFRSGKEKAILEEIPEAEYPAAIREDKTMARVFCIGK